MPCTQSKTENLNSLLYTSGAAGGGWGRGARSRACAERAELAERAAALRRAHGALVHDGLPRRVALAHGKGVVLRGAPLRRALARARAAVPAGRVPGADLLDAARVCCVICVLENLMFDILMQQNFDGILI